MTLVLEGMSPAQEQGWLVLLDLFQNRRNDWTLIGGQMMYILGPPGMNVGDPAGMSRGFWL